MRIRRATVDDIFSFQRLAAAFLIEQKAGGGILEAAARNMVTLDQLFTQVVEEQLPGLCLIASEPDLFPDDPDVGVIMAGAYSQFGTEPIEFVTEPMAHGWVWYLKPALRKGGYGKILLEAAYEVATQKGFKSASTGVSSEGFEGVGGFIKLGWKPAMVVVAADLDVLIQTAEATVASHGGEAHGLPGGGGAPPGPGEPVVPADRDAPPPRQGNLL